MVSEVNPPTASKMLEKCSGGWHKRQGFDVPPRSGAAALRLSLQGSHSITRVRRNVCACERGNALGPQPAEIYGRA